MRSRSERPSGLGRPFRRFVIGETVNGLGTMVASVALPLVAVDRLHGGALAVGVLEAVEWLPAMTIGLPAGALVDRHQRQARPVMIAASAGQAVTISVVPAAAAADALSFPLLIAAAFATGMLGTLFQAGYSPYLRQLVASDDLGIAAGRLRSGQSAAMVSGPALGGVLASTIGPATAVLADVASFLVSLVALAMTRPPAPPAAAGASPPGDGQCRRRPPIRVDIAAGVRHLYADRRLRTVAAGSACANLFLTAIGAVEIVFLVRTVGVSAASIGGLFAFGGLGGLAGAASSRPLTRRYGTDQLARSALAVTAPAAFLIPLTSGSTTVVPFAAGGFLVSYGISLAGVALTTIRLQECPVDLQARVSAASRVLGSATIPAGALAGGALAGAAGTRAALAIIAAGYVLFSLVLRYSPLRDPAPSRPTQLPGHTRPSVPSLRPDGGL